MCHTHRYTRKISEPAPLLSQHEAQIKGLRGFPVIKITVAHQVCMSPASTAVWAWRQTHINTRRTKIVNTFVLCLFLHVWLAKIRRPLILAPWLPMPLHGMVFEVWDLPCISVVTHETTKSRYYINLFFVRLYLFT